VNTFYIGQRVHVTSGREAPCTARVVAVGLHDMVPGPSEPSQEAVTIRPLGSADSFVLPLSLAQSALTQEKRAQEVKK